MRRLEPFLVRQLGEELAAEPWEVDHRGEEGLPGELAMEEALLVGVGDQTGDRLRRRRGLLRSSGLVRGRRRRRGSERRHRRWADDGGGPGGRRPSGVKVTLLLLAS